MKYTKAIHGFTIVLERLRRQLWDPRFMEGIHNILVEPTGSPKENPVLLGCVNTSNNLPNWFPFKVQYVFESGEQVVNKLWLIANNQRCIFVVEAHPHDLAQLYAAYSQALASRKKALPADSVVANSSTQCEQPATI